MRIPTYLTMAMVPVALVAQTPAMPDYTAILKAETPGIEALLKEFRVQEALQKAESLLPATLPAFDKSSAGAGMKASISFSSLTRLYLLTAKAAVQAGEWEKVLDLCTKADACAKMNYKETQAAFAPSIATWTEAVANANTFVAEQGERVKAIQAKPGRTPQEEAEVQAFQAKDKVWQTTKNASEKAEAGKWLQANVAHYNDLVGKAITPQEQETLNAWKIAQMNLVNGPKALKAFNESIEATRVESDMCVPKIESTRKNIQSEADEIAKGVAETKVKGKLVKETSGPKYDQARLVYFENVLNTKGNYESRPDKLAKMNFLYRLRHNVMGTEVQAKVEAVIARVLADKDPLAVEKKATKGKKAK